MSTIDRLAAARRQKEQDIELSRLNNPSYASQGGSTLRSPPPPPSGTGPSSFLTEVSSVEQDIQRLHSNVSAISTTRIHYLTSVDGNGEEDNEKLENLTYESRQLTQSIKRRIEQLERQAPLQDSQIRRNQIGLLRKHFLEAIQNYQQVEHEGDMRSRQQISKQLHIVKPDTTPEEVQAFIDGGHQQVFAEALTTSTRYGESRLAYKEVQDRQQDLRRMEKTLAELAQLFNDMAILVEQQDTVVEAVEQTAVDIESNTKGALENTKLAVISARNYRKGRWICFGIFVAICCILAIVLGIVFGTRK
ncbi:syntaxin-like protein [Ephemerocybe angulata]|uniref:Syntaxin-like protein n=1 Tax=Ephemerocybe angulata TaxID=980116 RepID=A0A8H6IIW1_9AGAR|nr:syntaxin-like protein [Tulosesus angulatus]